MNLSREKINELTAILADLIGEPVVVTQVTNGFNVRIKKKLIKPNTLHDSGYAKEGICSKCGAYGYIDWHHIIAKSAGGRDDYLNLLPLCRKDHMRLHSQDWDVCSIIGEDVYRILKERYK